MLLSTWFGSGEDICTYMYIVIILYDTIGDLCTLQKRTLKGHISVIKGKQAEKVKKKLQEQVCDLCV